MIYFNTVGAMTVGSLIEELQKLPKDMKAFTFDDGQFRDIALWKPSLKQRKYKNGFWDEDRPEVNTFVNANDHDLPGDSEPEDCLVITTRKSSY